jgi:hypothetical protein
MNTPVTENNFILAQMLAVAVPLWQEQLREQPWEDIQRRAGEINKILAEKGDLLFFRSKKKGETAKIFNQTAEGIALLSFVPGGVSLFGQHWETQHPGLVLPRLG